MSNPRPMSVAHWFILVIVLLAIDVAVSVFSIYRMGRIRDSVEHSHEVLLSAERLLSALKDAETGQRGYLVTGREEFLEPYNAALLELDRHFKRLRELTDDNPDQQANLNRIEPIIAQRLAFLEAAIVARRGNGFEAAQALVLEGHGKQAMDSAREIMDQVSREESELLKRRSVSAGRAEWITLAAFIFAASVGLAMLFRVLALIRRDVRRREELARELEEQVEDRTRQLVVMNRELEAFSYSVSHDLRAPLRSISGFCEAIDEDYADKLDEQGRQYLRRVVAATRRMGELIDDLINLSRVTRSELRRGPVDVSLLAREILTDLAGPDPNPAIEAEIQPDLNAEADPRMLRIALSNLFSNAIKFSSRNPRPRICLGRVRDAAGEDAFFIRDNGVGFDMAFVNKLFAPFQRLHGPEEFKGTGIGLAIVQRVVHKHGGRVWAESRPGEGATFYFTL